MPELDYEPPNEPDDDPNRVDPAEHRGRDEGLLSRDFRLARHRDRDDITGPRPIERDDDEDDDDEECEP